MVAIERRHWDTAKLILSIAEAQHKPDISRTSATEEKFSDDESESESMDIDEDGPEPKPIDFADIAARPSKNPNAKVDPVDKWATFDVILRQDRSEFLDAYIRETGAGVYSSRTGLPTIELDTDGADGEAVDKKKKHIYLGLDWHGLKRSERGKSNGTRAADYGSLKILEYLSSSRPLAA
ncbi:unnamed protein product [Peniophora sp. CBMAI 1063]|nr:unnamed protein product [Peniophora sp. CBMAI 1063]